MLHTIARVEDLKDRRPASARICDVELVVLRIDGEVSVFQGACPHQGTSLSTGSVEGTALTCASHQWCFDTRTGERIDRPGKCLHRFDVSTTDGEIQVDADEVRQWAASKARPSPHAPKKGSAARTIDSLPGPSALPVVGNLFSIRPGKIHAKLREWAETHGKTYRVVLPGVGKGIVFSDEDTLRGILKDRPATFRRVHSVETINKELGTHGVFSEEGARWRRQRRLVMPSFNMAQLHSFHATMKKILGRLKKRWERAARAGTTLRVQDEMTRFTVDITTSLAFGHDLNTIEDQGGDLRDHLELILPRVSARLLAPFPYWRYVRFPKDRAFDRAMARVRGVVTDLVERARREMAGKTPQEATTFLESLVSAEDDGGEKLSDEEIVGNVFTMLLAGEDTTAHTLTWIIHFMTEDPQIQERMGAEVDAVIGSEYAEDLSDYDRLPYVNAVAMEAMRLRPVAPLIFKEPTTDVEIENIAVPKGTPCILLGSQPGFRSEHFDKPERFDPERWLPGNGSRDVLLPFGYGARHCPGRNLALIEIQSVLALMSKNFAVNKTPDHPPVDDIFGFVVHASPITVNLRTRAG